MALYYCSRGDITDLLPSLVGSDISTTAQQDAKLRKPAKAWIDSVYPHDAPFPVVPANDPTEWLINSTTHESGDSSVDIDGGAGNPAVGDLFRVALDFQWNRESNNLNPDLVERTYRATAYSANSLTYEPNAEYDFPDNAPLHFGTPVLVREAAKLYAVHLAYKLIRDNPLDKEAMSLRKQAKDILQIPEKGFMARARPESTSDLNTGGVAVLRRA